MRSFAEYRKTEFKRKVYMVPMKESINCFLEVLKIDLLQRVKLPEMIVEGNLVLNTTYNYSAKQDYEQNRRIIESIIRHYDANLYPAIIEEAEAAVANSAVSPDPSASFESMLVDKVNAMCDQLVQDIEQALNSTRSNAPEEPEDSLDMGGSSSPTNSGAGSGTGTATPPSPAPTGMNNPSNAPTGANPQSNTASPQSQSQGHGHGHANSNVNTLSGQSHGAMSGSHNPTSGFTPAAMGSFRPADGYRKGLGRLLGGLVPRSWRQAWHNDPNRKMAKEHVVEIEKLLVENTSAVVQLVNNFRKELVQFITDKSSSIASVAGGGPSLINPKPTSNPMSNMNPMGKSNVLPVDAEEMERSTGPEKPKLGTDPKTLDLASGQKTQIEKMADAGDPVASAKVNQSYANIKAACEALGMSFSLEEKSHRKEGGWDKHGVKPVEVYIDGKPASEIVGGGYKAFIRLLCYKIYEHPELMKSKLTDTRKSKMLQPKGGVNGGIFKNVADYLGIKSTSMASQGTATEILQKLGAKLRLGQAGSVDPATQQNSIDPSVDSSMGNTPAIQPTGVNPSVQPNNTAVPSAGGSAINPTGSQVARPKLGKPNVLPMIDNNSNSPEEFIANFQANHPDVWKICVACVGDQISKLIADWFKEGSTPDEIEESLFNSYEDFKQQIKPEDQAKILGKNIEPERTAEVPPSAEPEAIEDPAANIADDNDIEPTSSTTPKDRLISAMTDYYGRAPSDEEMQHFSDDLSDDQVNDIINVMKNGGSSEPDAMDEEPDGLTNAEQQFKKQIDFTKGKVDVGSSAQHFKDLVNSGSIRPEIMNKILTDAGIDPKQIFSDEKPKELLTSPINKAADQASSLAPEPDLDPEKDLMGSEEFSYLKRALHKAYVADADAKNAAAAANGMDSDPSAPDDEKIKRLVQQAGKECEAIVDNGGTVSQALENLKKKIELIKGQHASAIQANTPVPETPSIANQEEPEVAPKTKPIKGRKSKSDKKGGLEGHKDGSPTLGNIPIPSAKKEPTEKKELSPEEWLAQHPELKDDEDSHGDLDVDPDHVDDGKKPRRRKKRLADATNNFDAIIDRFKQRLTEAKVDQSKLSASQKLIFA